MRFGFAMWLAAVGGAAGAIVVTLVRPHGVLVRRAWPSARRRTMRVGEEGPTVP